MLEPIFEADFVPSSYGFRPRRRVQDAIAEIHYLASPTRSYEWVFEADITACFDEIDHRALLDRVRHRIGDRRVLALVSAFLRAGILAEDGVHRRGPDLPGLVHHSDRGVQGLSIKYTERLADAEAVGSVGSKGDSYDNALAETVNGLYKAELINRAGPWRTVEQVELATAEWVHFWNDRRLHSACGDIPPAEFEAAYHQRLQATTEAA